MIKPFMDTKTVEKIRFLHADDPAKARAVLANVFDNLDDLERSLGGNGEEYDFEKYGAQMRCAPDAFHASFLSCFIYLHVLSPAGGHERRGLSPPRVAYGYRFSPLLSYFSQARGR